MMFYPSSCTAFFLLNMYFSFCSPMLKQGYQMKLQFILNKNTICRLHKINVERKLFKQSMTRAKYLKKKTTINWNLNYETQLFSMYVFIDFVKHPFDISLKNESCLSFFYSQNTHYTFKMKY